MGGEAGLRGPRLRYDDHVHAGAWSGHASPFALRELVAAGDAAGVAVCLREHAPLPVPFLRANPRAVRVTPDTPGAGRAVGLFVEGTPGGEPDNLDAFLAEVAAAGLPLGFEIDALDPIWLPDSLLLMETIAARAARHGLAVECFNVSHHYPWDASFGGLQGALAAAGGAKPFLLGYFATLRAYIATGRFGAVSHLESLRKFDRLAAGGPPFAGLMPLYHAEIRRTLETMQLHGTALEYNTNGLTTWGRAYVSPETLTCAVALGIPIVVGSDAHAPGAVGRGFDGAATELASAGVREVVTFRAGRAVQVPLAAAER